MSACKTVPDPTQQATNPLKDTESYVPTFSFSPNYFSYKSYDSLPLMSFVCLTKQTLTFAYNKINIPFSSSTCKFITFYENFLSLFMHHQSL